MKKAVRRKRRWWEIFLTAFLVGLTVVAAALIVKGVPLVYQAAQAIDEGVEATVEYLQTATASVSGDPVETGSADIKPEKKVKKRQAGEAVLSVFAAARHDVALYSGLTSEHLWLGAARVAESAQPGAAGNCVVYGHRDSAFRCLKDVKVGDQVLITTKNAEFVYQVEKLERCLPEADIITQAYDEAYLTLVTCYPFIYSGPSPERYLVICKLAS